LLRVRPDFLFTYNGYSYDNPYIISRLKRLSIYDLCMSYTSDLYTRASETKKHPKARSGYNRNIMELNDVFLDLLKNRCVSDKLHIYKAPGIINFDLYQKFLALNENKLKLKEISKKYLGENVTKKDMEIDKMFDYYRENDTEGIRKAVIYNLWDSLLLPLLVAKKKFISEAIGVCETTFCHMERVMNYGKSSWIDSLMTQTAMDVGYEVPYRPKTTDEKIIDKNQLSETETIVHMIRFMKLNNLFNDNFEKWIRKEVIKYDENRNIINFKEVKTFLFQKIKSDDFIKKLHKYLNTEELKKYNINRFKGGQVAETNSEDDARKKIVGNLDYNSLYPNNILGANIGTDTYINIDNATSILGKIKYKVIETENRQDIKMKVVFAQVNISDCSGKSGTSSPYLGKANITGVVASETPGEIIASKYADNKLIVYPSILAYGVRRTLALRKKYKDMMEHVEAEINKLSNEIICEFPKGTTMECDKYSLKYHIRLEGNKAVYKVEDFGKKLVHIEFATEKNEEERVKLMKDIAQKLELMNKLSIDQDTFNTYQKSAKETGNTIYGVTGAIFSNFFNERISSSITAMGRRMFALAKSMIHGKYKKENFIDMFISYDANSKEVKAFEKRKEKKANLEVITDWKLVRYDDDFDQDYDLSQDDLKKLIPILNSKKIKGMNTKIIAYDQNGEKYRIVNRRKDVYGDTDSIFTQLFLTPDEDQLMTTDFPKFLKLVWDELKAICDNINNVTKEISKNLAMKLECVYVNLIMIGKKNYICQKYEFPDSPSKVDLVVKGLSIKKSDTSQIEIDILQEFLLQYQKGNNADDMIKFLYESIKKEIKWPLPYGDKWLNMDIDEKMNLFKKYQVKKRIKQLSYAGNVKILHFTLAKKDEEIFGKPVQVMDSVEIYQTFGYGYDVDKTFVSEDYVPLMMSQSGLPTKRKVDVSVTSTFLRANLMAGKWICIDWTNYLSSKGSVGKKLINYMSIFNIILSTHKSLENLINGFVLMNMMKSFAHTDIIKWMPVREKIIDQYICQNVDRFIETNGKKGYPRSCYKYIEKFDKELALWMVKRFIMEEK